MRADMSGIIPQESLLWGQAGRKTDPRWLAALWTKVIGPFGGKVFQSRRHFWLFWLGEKCQVAGFLRELLRRKSVNGNRPGVLHCESF
ncbi:MAG: hypothetical protein H0X01_05470 [Nitrospira sp.]|nr:hypothetical protein [Nitrospira sp.]